MKLIPGLERQTDCDVSFDCYAKRQISARRLSNQPDGINEGCDVGKNLPVVKAQVGSRVDEYCRQFHQR